MPEVTMGFLMEDYIAHMEHHLKDLRPGCKKAACKATWGDWAAAGV